MRTERKNRKMRRWRKIDAQNKRNRTKAERQRSFSVLVVLPILSLLILALLAKRVWNEYRDALMRNQKEQLLMISETLGNHISIDMEEYEEDLAFLAELDLGTPEAMEVCRRYVEEQQHFVRGVFWEDDAGSSAARVWIATETDTLENPILLTQSDETHSLWQYENEAGHKYLIFKMRRGENRSLCLAIDEEAYYDALISDVHVGTNGYVVVKNSSGLIIMHPSPIQWGIDVIAGRKKLYPDLDYTSLEELIEKQNRGEAGVSEHYSYWWTNPELPRVKKVASYAPAEIGNDFWIISTVVDYTDFYTPIAEGFSKLLLIFIGMICVFLSLFPLIAKLLFDRQKASREIDYLRELNDVLEEVHRSEEKMAHQQRLQIMGTMTGGIAHEFNNFLTPVMGYAELLRAELPEGSELAGYAKEICDASENAKEVVRQISTLSRRNTETVYTRILAKKTLERALKMVASICPETVKFESEIRLSDENILGNTTQLNQVLLNLCVNAVHAIGREPGTLRITADCISKELLSKRVRAQLSVIWTRYIRIMVEDTGCGMDEKTLGQIFDPFFTTKKGGEGTGLGLALAEQIITAHKGCIYAESCAGEGSSFCILLPVAEEGGAKQDLQLASDRSIRVVAADDNARLLQMLERDFAEGQIEIETCRKAAEVQVALRKKETDLLLIDESIEGAGGIEVCMAVSTTYPRLFRIVMTNVVTREIVEARQRHIIDGYVEKPVSREQILHMLRGFLEERVDMGQQNRPESYTWRE